MTHMNFIEGNDGLSIYGTDGRRVSVDGYSNSWSVIGGTKGFTDAVVLDIFHNSMVIAPSSTEAVQLSLLHIPVEAHSSDFDVSIISHAQIKVDALAQVTGQLTEFGQPVPEGKYPKTVTVSRDTWSTVRTNAVDFGAMTEYDMSFSITYTITGHEGKLIYVTLPALHDRNSFLSNPMVLSAKYYLPDFLWDIDIAQDEPQAPLFKLIDVLSHDAGGVMTAYSQLFEYDRSEVGPEYNFDDSEFKSGLTDAQTHYPEFRKWLSQFTGGNLVYNFVSTTPMHIYLAVNQATNAVVYCSEISMFCLPAAGTTDTVTDIDWLSNYPAGREMLDYVSAGVADGSISIYMVDYEGRHGLRFHDENLGFTLADDLPDLLARKSEGVIVRWRRFGEPWNYVHLGHNAAASWAGYDLFGGAEDLTFGCTGIWTFSDEILDFHQDRWDEIYSTTSMFSGIENVEFDIGWFDFSYSAGPLLCYQVRGSTFTGLASHVSANFSIGDGVAAYDAGASEYVKVISDPNLDPIVNETYGLVAIPFRTVFPEPTTFFSDSLDDAVIAIRDSLPSRFFTNDDDVDQFQRWQIANGYYGFKAGTTEAIIESARLVLSGDDRVAVLPGYGDDPFAIEVRTITSATPAIDWATTSSKAVLAAVEPARPMGYSIIHTTADEFYMTLGSPGLGLLDYAVLG